MEEPKCAIPVGTHVGPYWKDKDISTILVVCDRHRKQFDTSMYGPFEWEEVK